MTRSKETSKVKSKHSEPLALFNLTFCCIGFGEVDIRKYFGTWVGVVAATTLSNDLALCTNVLLDKLKSTGILLVCNDADLV